MFTRLTKFLIVSAIALPVCAQQIDYVRQVQNKPYQDSREYVWSRTSGSGASGTLTSTGSKTITLTVCPKGLAVGYSAYISGGTGTAEAVSITATTCSLNGGSAGTVTVTTANTHSGAWVIGTATSGIQEAINAAGGAQVTVNVSLGTHTTYGTVTIDQNQVAIVGQGAGSIIAAQFTSGKVFHYTGGGNGGIPAGTGIRNSISNLQIFGPSVGNSLTAVHLSGQVQFRAEDLTIDTVQKGVAVIDATGAVTSIVWIRHCVIGSNLTPVTGIGIHQVGGADLYVSNTVITGIYDNQPEAGIKIEQSLGTKLFYNEVFATGRGVYVCPGDGQEIMALGSFGNWYDSTTIDGMSLEAHGTGVIREVQSSSDWFATNQRNGILLGPNGSITSASFVNPLVYNNGQVGIMLFPGNNHDIEIVGGQVYSNSTTSPGTYHGFYAGPGASDFRIIGGMYGLPAADTAHPNTQGYGVFIDLGASDNYIIRDAVVGPNMTGGIIDHGTGTNKVVRGLLGQSVTATIASASTIALPPGSGGAEIFFITGTTPIVTITGGYKGQSINFVFLDAAPGGVTTGGNIAKAQTATQKQSIRMTFDGSNWY